MSQTFAVVIAMPCSLKSAQPWPFTWRAWLPMPNLSHPGKQHLHASVSSIGVSAERSRR